MVLSGAVRRSLIAVVLTCITALAWAEPLLTADAAAQTMLGFADAAAHESDGSQGDHAGRRVGDAMCVACHTDAGDKFANTFHGRVFAAGDHAAVNQGEFCETCHGAGEAHVASGGRETTGALLRFDAADAEGVERENAACIACHRQDTGVHWIASTHESEGVGCTACHQVKSELGNRHQLAKPSVNETCVACHLFQRARMNRSAHMPLREGAMQCTDCHDPHGGPGEAELKTASVNDSCYSCHADKRGPFLWEHSPVTEDCLSCHDPHGSNRGKMLTQSVPRLCQQCHIETLHPTEARQPGNKFVIGGACLNCHLNIHGSNHPSGFALTR